MRERIQTLSMVAMLLVSIFGFAGYTAINNLPSTVVNANVMTDSAEESTLFTASTLLPIGKVQAQNESGNEGGGSSGGSDECEQLGVPILDHSEVCPEDTPGGNIIYSYLALILEFLSAGVGLVITLMIAVSGVQYIMARDDPKKIEAAKHKIWNAVLALILFILMYALINFIVPGGVF